MTQRKYGARYMCVRLDFDRESFTILKELLREKSLYTESQRCNPETPAERRDREAFKRVFDQIRNTEYRDE